MKILIVSARFPDSRGKGDQQRALQLARLLCADHEVRMITTARPASVSQREQMAAIAPISVVDPGPIRRAAAAALGPLTGLPVQVGWMMPRRAHRRVVAAAAGVELVIAVTIRCLRAPLPAPTLLDHVDALSANMRERASLERHLTLRAGARVEARLLARHERRAARWVCAQTAVSPLDAAALPDRPEPVVLPLVLDLEPAASAGDADADGAAERDIDVIMTGDMRYPPNRDGAEWLANEIVPALRAGGRDPRVVVAGRGADTLPPLPAVELLSDVPDIGALLRRAKVAAVPLRHGTGTPIKLLEAAANGAAPVATPWVAAATGLDVETAADATGFAAAIERLLADASLRSARVRAARVGLRTCSSDNVRGLLQALAERCVKNV